MIKVLLRKNLQETGALYFRDKKKGGSLNSGAKFGMCVLYAFIYLSIAGSFFAMSFLFMDITDKEHTWIAWAIMAVLAILMSSMVNALVSYPQLYLAKDNDMLLSMPLKPRDILISRMLSVYLMGLVYISAIWLPLTVIAYIKHRIGIAGIFGALFMMLVLGIMALAFTCLFGWLVALFATRFGNQKFLTVIVSVVFLAAVYYFSFRMNAMIDRIVANIEGTGEIIKSSLYPFYQLGLAMNGSLAAAAMFIGICAAFMAVSYLLMDKTFITLSTTKKTGTKAKFSEDQIRTASVSKALLRRERLRFTGSVTYMLNSGLGALFMLIGTGYLIVKGNMIKETALPLIEAIPEVRRAVPAVVMMTIALLESLAVTSAASVSMEGKYIWMIQTMPVEPAAVLKAKSNLSLIIQGVPGVLLASVAADRLGMSPAETSAITVFALAFAYLSSRFGTFENVKHARLDWTTEQTPVKQGAAVAFTMFGGWGLALVLAGGCYFVGDFVGADIFIIAVSIIMILATAYIEKWLYVKGAEIFRYLS